MALHLGTLPQDLLLQVTDLKLPLGSLKLKGSELVVPAHEAGQAGHVCFLQLSTSLSHQDPLGMVKVLKGYYKGHGLEILIGAPVPYL